jgi:hypothetical protein
LVINALCFPLGVLLFALLARPVVSGLRRLREGEELPPDEAAGLRIKALRLGRYGVWVGLGFWLGASLIYPICLHAAVPDLPADEARELFIHFLASLTICGLIAAAYPFFAGTALGVWAIYPAFLQPGAATEADRAEVRRVERLLWPFLALAAAVPLVGVGVLVIVHTQIQRWIIGGLIAAALASLGMAALLARRIQRNLADLAPLLFPPGAVTESDESTLTRSWTV